jgi:hypothetical protein
LTREMTGGGTVVTTETKSTDSTNPNCPPVCYCTGTRYLSYLYMDTIGDLKNGTTVLYCNEFHVRRCSGVKPKDTFIIRPQQLISQEQLLLNDDIFLYVYNIVLPTFIVLRNKPNQRQPWRPSSVVSIRTGWLGH